MSIVWGLAAELNSNIEEPIELFYGLEKEDLFRLGEVLGLTAIVAIFFVVVGYLLNEIKFAIVSRTERKSIAIRKSQNAQFLSNKYLALFLITVLTLLYVLGISWLDSHAQPINTSLEDTDLDLFCGRTKNELLRPAEVLVLMILSGLVLTFIIRPILLTLAALGRIFFSQQQSRIIFWTSVFAPLAFFAIVQFEFLLELFESC